jgi:hypothetical protein
MCVFFSVLRTTRTSLAARTQIFYQKCWRFFEWKIRLLAIIVIIIIVMKVTYYWKKLHEQWCTTNHTDNTHSNSNNFNYCLLYHHEFKMVKERQPKLVTVPRISMKDKGQTHVLSVGFGQPGSDWMRTRKCLDSMDRHLNSSHSTHFPLAFDWSQTRVSTVSALAEK